MSRINAFINKNRVTSFFIKTRRRKLFFGAIIILIFLNQFNSSRKPDYELDVVSVKKQTLEENISASGKVNAENFAELSFLASENIEEIIAKDGSYLKKGDIIAKLNSTSLYQSYLQAEASLRAAEADVRSTYDSLQGKETTETFADIDTRTASEVARDNAYRTFVIAQKNLSNSSLVAPFDGVLNYNNGTSIGKYTNSLTPTFTMVDPKSVYFSAEVNELDIGKVKKGTPVKLEIDAHPGVVFDEAVTAVGYVNTFTSTGGTAYRIRISLPENQQNMFRVGMNGDAELILSKQANTISIPQSAIVEEDGESFVWIITPVGKTAKVMVETGISSLNDIEILSGLDERVLVIERPPSKIEEGDKVKTTIEGDENEKKRFFGLF